MTVETRKGRAFRPMLSGARLENRELLSTGAVATGAASASRPVSLSTFRHQAAKVKVAYIQQFQAASSQLQSEVAADVNQLYESGSAPTTQQLTDFDDEAAGAVDAMALRFTSQASLLPDAGNRLAPAIQNALLGASTDSLATRLAGFAGSSVYNGSARNLEAVLMVQINRELIQNTAQLSTFFTTTPLSRLSHDRSGQRISLEQYMGGQLVAQVGNTFGALAQSYPTVANSVLFPDNTTTAPTQQLLDQFNAQSANAVSTAAFELASDLQLFPGSASVAAQIEPALFGSGTNKSSLITALQDLPYGSTTFNSAVSTTFNTAFQNVIAPLSGFLSASTGSDLSLPTSGFTNPFGSTFSASTFDSGFNNGFASDTGFIGFGTAPVAYDTNFGTGFNGSVASLNTSAGLVNSTGVAGGEIRS
jgi:hypothetical protein